MKDMKKENDEHKHTIDLLNKKVTKLENEKEKKEFQLQELKTSDRELRTKY
jgi:hypothetical protein